MFHVLGMERVIGDMVRGLQLGLIEQLRSTSPAVSRSVIVSAVDDILMPEFVGQLDGLRDQIVQLYAGRMTAEEMRHAAAIFSTPMGQRVWLVLPELAERTSQIAVRWGEGIFNQAFTKHRDALRARGLIL